MDLGKAFTFLTDDERWTTKLGIGTGIALAANIIPFLPALLLTGYELDITRRYANNEEPVLPEWEDFGKYFMDGLFVTLAKIIYGSPLLILFCLSFGIFLLPALAAGNEDAAAALGAVGIAVWSVMICLGMLFSLLIAFLTPAINIQYVRTNDFGSLLKVGEIIRMTRENMSSVVMVVVGLVVGWIIISLLAGVLSFTICGAFIVTWVGMAYIRMVSGHLVGQAMVEMDGKANDMKYDL